MKSRRHFLQNTVAAALFIPLARIQAAEPLAKSPSYSRFASLAGTEFTATTDDGKSVRLVLESVIPQKIQPNLEAFALRFRSRTPAPLTQGTYPFQHKSAGPLSIFVVPNSGGNGAHYYEAVFNRLVA